MSTPACLPALTIDLLLSCAHLVVRCPAEVGVRVRRVHVTVGLLALAALTATTCAEGNIVCHHCAMPSATT